MPNADGSGATLTLPNSAGATSLSLRYSSADPHCDGTTTAYINGSSTATTVSIPSTGSWVTTNTVSIPLATPFVQQINTIRIVRQGNGCWYNIYGVTSTQ